MKEENIIAEAKRAFSKSEFIDKVNAKTGINYNKWPFITGFILGVRYYANRLYCKKNIFKVISSILKTKDVEETKPLETEDIVIIYILKNYSKLEKECRKMRKIICDLNDELAQIHGQYKENEKNLTQQIKDLEYWLTTIGKRNEEDLVNNRGMG